MALHNGIVSAAGLEMSLFQHEMRFLVDSRQTGDWPPLLGIDEFRE
jgi:hypothetical protein